jgi:NADH-quinone oxidoreductase subunit L
MHFAMTHSYLIPGLPLLAAVLVGLFGKRGLRGQSHWPIWLGVGASAVLAFQILYGMLGSAHAVPLNDPHYNPLAISLRWFSWITAGEGATLFNVTAGAWIDPLTAVMLCVVCGIGFLITVFAAGYMKGESGYWRFFAYLGLFIFAMTCLVMGDNLIMLYLGWEGVGLCSYLLIGYYNEKPAAREAAKKAFLVNRVGDFGFAIGIMLIWYCFGTVSYFGDGVGTNTGLLERAASGLFASTDPDTIKWMKELFYWIPFCLMLGAFGKSAQFPLHVWLPDAMEGPTPVSALIHAATMVTAGVYMIARLGALFVGNHAAMVTIAVIGGFTAIFAATIALRQYDLKKVFAYSTISQLGFMFVAVGVLAPVAGVFHLVTHAFFKALLFLSSGVIMHAMLGHLDLRQMSGIKKQLPITRILCLIGCLALAGFPLTAGYWSKDEIIGASHHASRLLDWTLLFTALLTAYYTFRVYFRVFEGPNLVPATLADSHTPDVEHAALTDDHGRLQSHAADAHDTHGHGSTSPAGDHTHHNHEPLLMIVPLVLLAIGALFAGVINLPFGFGVPAHALGHFLGESPSFQLAYQVAERSVDAAHKTPEYLAVLKTQYGQPVAEHHVEWLGLLLGAVVSCLGIAASYMMHLKDRAAGDALPAKAWSLSLVLEHKYWIDPIYHGLVVMPLRLVGKLFNAFDFYIVDGIVNVIALFNWIGGFSLRAMTQRGYLQGYALTAVLGVAVILFVVFVV